MHIFERETVVKPKYTRHIAVCFLVLFFIIVCVNIFKNYLDSAPSSFNIDTPIIITEGSTVSQISKVFADAGFVRSHTFLYLILTKTHADEFVQAGTYSFKTQLSSKEIAYAITHGESRAPLLKVTFPEGFQMRDFEMYFPNSNEKIVPNDIHKYEGYLFPDTYFITSETTTSDLLTLLNNTFYEKIEPYSDEIEKAGLTLETTISLASIVEREAKDEESKKIVAGILQNRLRDEMPLQVDATFDYILDKESSELTVDDLQIDSPYNTYTKKGLPPTPISNPGIASIEAVLSPTTTEYYYYLTAPDGTFHYAKTFEEHKRNKAKYLQ